MAIIDKRNKEITDQSSPKKVLMKNDKFCEKINNKHVMSEGQRNQLESLSEFELLTSQTLGIYSVNWARERLTAI